MEIQKVMKREITLKIIVDWKDYDDVSDELIIEDIFEDFRIKDGVEIKVIKNENISRSIKRT
mgnify:CR=1 FL=1